MIKTEIYFSVEDAVRLFRDAGLTVIRKDVEQTFHSSHRPVTVQFIPTWIVVNPHTREEELLKDCFIKHISSRYKQLFLEIEKIDIYKLFDNKKK